MRNPFAELGKPTVENPRGELIEGQFTCMEEGCWKVVKEARYITEVKLLTWVCPNEHVSKIEGMNLDG